MRVRRRRLITLWIAAALGLSTSPAFADPLSEGCNAVNQNKASSCDLARNAGEAWQLTTRLLVGGGGKRGVTGLEREFCRAARERGVPAHVTRWNAIGTTAGNGAKMAWSCGSPAAAVSTGPPVHAR